MDSELLFHTCSPEQENVLVRCNQLEILSLVGQGWRLGQSVQEAQPGAEGVLHSCSLLWQWGNIFWGQDDIYSHSQLDAEHWPTAANDNLLALVSEHLHLPTEESLLALDWDPFLMLAAAHGAFPFKQSFIRSPSPLHQRPPTQAKPQPLCHICILRLTSSGGQGGFPSIAVFSHTNTHTIILLSLSHTHTAPPHRMHRTSSTFD